jgi:hypothetical protein
MREWASLSGVGIEAGLLIINLHQSTLLPFSNNYDSMVKLPSTPERQNVSIYMGYKNAAMLHREGQEDLPLKIVQCD